MKHKLSSPFEFAKAFVKRVHEQDLLGLAAELSYVFLLSLFPFLLFLVALVGTFASPAFAAAVVDQLVRVLPPDAQAVLVEPVRNILTSKQPGILSVGGLGALWSASAAMQTIIKGLNKTHLVKENRGFLRRAITKLFLTVVLLAVVLIAAGTVIGAQALSKNPAIVGLTQWAGPWLTWGGLGVAFCLALLGVAVIYWEAPALDVHPFKLVTPGACLFALGLVVGTALFGWYVTNFGSYNRLYGSIAGMIVLLVWAYWSGFLLLAGASFNALIEERAQARVPISRDSAGNEEHPRREAA